MMQALAVLLLLLALAEPSRSLGPADCKAAEPKAGDILNLINAHRREGYVFHLLRVADAHTHIDEEKSAVIHYLVLDVIETDCSVLSRIHWEACQPGTGKRPSGMVIGKCKVVAVTHSNTSREPEWDKMIGFNCTTSSVSSALTYRSPPPVIINYLDDQEQYRGQAEKALKQYKENDASASSFQVVKVERVVQVRGGERSGLYVDFSIRNQSTEAPLPHFSRPCPVFGFCRTDFVYNVGNSDLNNPGHLTVDCEIFDVEDHRNSSSERHPHRHHGHFHRGRHHFSKDSDSIHRPLGHGCRERFHHHHSREPRQPPHTHQSSTMEERDSKDGPQDRLLPSSDNSPVKDDPEVQHPQGIPPPFGHDECHDNHRHVFHRHEPHEHGPHEPCPQGQGPCKPGPHGHGPHKHGPHGHGPHRHGPHGHGPHGHGPHRHGPHGPGRCGHGPPPGHSEEQGFHRPFPFPPREHGIVYQLPSLKKGEVLPLPEISIPSRDHGPHPGNQHPPRPEIQPFPQTPSESCPGELKLEYPQLLPFLEREDPK
ncbi:histidine-rich glycoprotein [Gracilinanus agilis]|uniref:histidine-rich glycoprotein n=1 Tax=Gracilinanus agilis TaxID=191870 RepID=UPI001CFCB1F0|nr:histidine-rich glycoprotein [Gracilinanus agilis]